MSTHELRETLARLLRQSQAHAGLFEALNKFPVEFSGRQVAGHPHTAWQQVEHMRLAAEDLVAYCKNSDYQPGNFPNDYWPAALAPKSSEAWSASVRQLLHSTEELVNIVENPNIDLYAKVPTAKKRHHHTLRAALILLDHNGYHTAQLIALRYALGLWPVSP